MKKTVFGMKKAILITTILFMAFGCGEFLDEAAPVNASINRENLFLNVENIRPHFNGIYRSIRLRGGGGPHQVGLQSLDMGFAARGEDLMVSSAFGWIDSQYEYAGRGNTHSGYAWNSCYAMIDQCNLILEAVDTLLKNNNIQLDQSEPFRAEARAIRAHCYYLLLLWYTLPYSYSGGESPGVPFYNIPFSIVEDDEEDKDDRFSYKGRGTVNQVMDSILMDLHYAVGEYVNEEGDKVLRLPASLTNKWQLYRTVAQGMLARAYLYKGDYENAARVAREAIGDEPIINNTEYTSGFSSIDNTEWIWGYEHTPDQTPFFASFASFWDYTRLSYAQVGAGFHVSNTLIRKFSSTDIRKETISDEVGSRGLLESGARLSHKFLLLSDYSADGVFMRVPELLLIEVESLARSGRETEAIDRLYLLQSTRDPEAERPDVNVSDEEGRMKLIDMILLERRKELYGEGMADWLDKKRLNIGWKRTCEHPEAGRYTFEGEERINCYVIQIPRSEVRFNPHIDDSETEGGRNERCQPLPSNDNCSF